jgi:hypothetical protein
MEGSQDSEKRAEITQDWKNNQVNKNGNKTKRKCTDTRENGEEEEVGKTVTELACPTRDTIGVYKERQMKEMEKGKKWEGKGVCACKSAAAAAVAAANKKTKAKKKVRRTALEKPRQGCSTGVAL